MDDSTRRMNGLDGLDEDSADTAAGIRIEIEETRAEMAETVGAIEEKLRPSALMARAADRVKETASARVHALTDAASETARAAGGAAQRAVMRTRESAGGLMGMMRDNPVPTALIAVGAGWLLVNARGNGQRQSPTMPTARETEPHWRGEMNGGETNPGSSMDLSSVRRGGRQAQAQMHRMTSENPLLVGAGALLIGAAFGLALPETEGENSLMGDARDSVVDRAQRMASDAAGRLQEQASGMAYATDDIAGATSPPRHD